MYNHHHHYHRTPPSFEVDDDSIVVVVGLFYYDHFGLAVVVKSLFVVGDGGVSGAVGDDDTLDDVDSISSPLPSTWWFLYLYL